MKLIILIAILSLVVEAPAHAQDCADINCYVKNTAERIARGRSNLGWCKNGTLTQNLTYGQTSLFVNRKPAGRCKDLGTETSCNGAVLELIVEFFQAYAKDKRLSVDEHIALETWNSTSLKDLRAHIFLYEPRSMIPFTKKIWKVNGKEIAFNRNSRLENFSAKLRGEIKEFESKSVAHGLNRMGLATPVKMAELTPGDILTFNRNMNKVENGVQTNKPDGSQHSVVFLGWIDRKQEDISKFDKAAGFKYVSSQTNIGGSGLGVKWAYFSGFCPQDPDNQIKKNDEKSCADQRYADDGSDGPNFPPQVRNQKSDCCVIKKDGGLTGLGMKGGRLIDPARWKSAFQVSSPVLKAKLEDLQSRALAERDAWFKEQIKGEASVAAVTSGHSKASPHRSDPRMEVEDVPEEERLISSPDFDQE